MTPSTGTALTGNGTGTPLGEASIQIDAASLTAAGATTVTSTTANEGSASIGFSVSAVNAGFGSFTLGTDPLSPYATTSVSIPVTGVPVTTPVTINFYSICSVAGKAELPASVQTVNGVATATYVDKGCASTDTITANVAGSSVSKTVSLTVQPPSAVSIQFVSAEPSTIVLKGTGSAGMTESSLVKFKVLDSNNQPIVGATVLLDLTTWVGGILLDGTSAPLSKTTDSNGEVTVSIQSGTIPTPVSVKATVTSTTPNFSTQSNQLKISTGRPAQDRFSLSIKTFNIEGGNIDGVTTEVGVISSDRLGNPVPDGTAVSFYAEGGQIDASCLTTNGKCTVNFTSANPRPSYDSEPLAIVTDGRVTILAYSLGEESFIDQNDNNLYDSGEPFTDLGDIYYDNNESLAWEAGETTIPFAANSQPCTNAILSSPGAISKANTCDGIWGAAYVRQTSKVIMSGSYGYVNNARPTAAFTPGISVPNTSYSMGGSCNASFSFYAFDQNRNPLPAGTTLTVANVPTDFASATVSSASVINTTAAGGTQHTLILSTKIDDSVTPSVCVPLASAVSLTVNMTTPHGLVSKASFTITP